MKKFFAILVIVGMAWASVGHAFSHHPPVTGGTVHTGVIDFASNSETDDAQLVIDTCCIELNSSCTFVSLLSKVNYSEGARLKDVTPSFVELAISERNPSSEPPPPRS